MPAEVSSADPTRSPPATQKIKPKSSSSLSSSSPAFSSPASVKTKGEGPVPSSTTKREMTPAPVVPTMKLPASVKEKLGVSLSSSLPRQKPPLPPALDIKKKSSEISPVSFTSAVGGANDIGEKETTPTDFLSPLSSSSLSSASFPPSPSSLPPSPSSLPTDPNMICKYRTGKCSHPRARKANGDFHSLCEPHRMKANESQRKLDRKKQAMKKMMKKRRQSKPLADDSHFAKR